MQQPLVVVRATKSNGRFSNSYLAQFFWETMVAQVRKVALHVLTMFFPTYQLKYNLAVHVNILKEEAS